MRFHCLVVVLMVLLLVGCSKLTMNNYNKLKAGMSYNEVITIIGAPDKCSDLMVMRVCEWGNEKKSINVTFTGDKAIFFTCNGLR